MLALVLASYWLMCLPTSWLVCRAGTMPTSKWVKCGDCLQQVRPTPEGRLSVRQIACEFGLDVDTVKFNGVRETYDTYIGFTAAAMEGGEAQDSAIIITETPAAGESTAGQGCWSYSPSPFGPSCIARLRPAVSAQLPPCICACLGCHQSWACSHWIPAASGGFCCCSADVWQHTRPNVSPRLCQLLASARQHLRSSIATLLLCTVWLSLLTLRLLQLSQRSTSTMLQQQLDGNSCLAACRVT